MDSQADFLPVGGSLLLLREAVANVCRGEGGAERVWCVRDHWDSGSDKKRCSIILIARSIWQFARTTLNDD